MDKAVEVVQIVLTGGLCLTAILLAPNQHDTDVPVVYEPYCRGAAAADPNERIHWLTIAIQIDPEFAALYEARGIGYAELDDLDRAIRDYSRAIELDPEYIEAYRLRAAAYYVQRNLDKAWADVRTAQERGCVFNPAFLDALREASGRTK